MDLRVIRSDLSREGCWGHSMSATGAPLLTLVAEPFPDLTEAEKKLLRAVAAGDIADCSSPNDAENDPKYGDTWGESRTIRAEIIRWLCVDREATKHVDAMGIRIGAAKIDGQLDLQYVTVSVPLVLWQCTVQEGVVLNGADTRLLAFIRSSLGNLSGVALSADGVQVRGAVFLRDGFQAKGEVRLIGATIGGDLDCTGGAFHNASGIAWDAEGIHVNGRVLLHDGFEAEGMVRLPGATIGGDLDCTGGAFRNPGGFALFADGVQVHSSVSLGDGFQAEGEVHLLGATIGGDLDCTGGAFRNPGGFALSADGIKVHRGVFLRDGFQAKGEVRLIGATMGTDLDCTGAVLHNPGGIALHAEGIHVNGRVFLRDGFQAKGEVRLLGVTIDGDLYCTGAVLHNPGGVALLADRARVSGNAFLRDGFQAKGEVRLIGATIGGDLDCTGGVFHNPDGIALFADKAHMGSYVFLRDGFRATGIVSLMDANAGPLVDDETSWPAPGTLRVSGFVYTTIAGGRANAKARLRWLERQLPDSFSPQPYQQLAKVLRESGREGDAKQVLIAKERVRRKRGNLGWAAWCWNLVLGFSMAHGYKPQRLLLGAMVFVLLGGWLFGAGYQAGTIVRAKKTEADVPYPAFNRWMYSLDTLLPIINFGLKDYWRPLDSSPASAISQQSPLATFIGVPFPRSFYPMITSRVTSGEFLRAYHWIHIGVGWLLITLGITGVTGLVRKD